MLATARCTDPGTMLDVARQSHIDWELTEEAFAKFLARLGPDWVRTGEKVGEKYEALREALVKFLD
jgi:hypothetical protein